MSNIEDVSAAFREFTEEREWGQFHDPKSLLLALVGEVGELSELYQWLPADRAQELSQAEPLRTRTAEEVADVFIYLLAFADVLQINLVDEALAKLKAADRRFPATRTKGVAPEKR